MIYEKYPELRYKYRNREFWCRGYYVDTAGKNAKKIEEYIRHQLKNAGAESEIFTEAAIQRIYEYSSGIARVIDKVCTSVLIYGSQNRMRLIDDHAVSLVLDCEFN